MDFSCHSHVHGIVLLWILLFYDVGSGAWRDDSAGKVLVGQDLSSNLHKNLVTMVSTLYPSIGEVDTARPLGLSVSNLV